MGQVDSHLKKAKDGVWEVKSYFDLTKNFFTFFPAIVFVFLLISGSTLGNFFSASTLNMFFPFVLALLVIIQIYLAKAYFTEIVSVFISKNKKSVFFKTRFSSVDEVPLENCKLIISDHSPPN